MAFRIWMSVVACLASTGQVAATDRIGDDRHRYKALPLVECSEANQLGIFVGTENCLLLSGELRWAGGYDSSVGFLTQHSELVSAVAVQATDFGPGFAVLTLTNKGTWSLDGWYTTPDTAKLAEAYVAIGDDLRLVAGLAPTILETGGDEALDWLGKRYGYGVSFPLGTDGEYPLTSNAIQVSATLTEGLSLAFGVEDGSSSMFYDTKPRAVGTLRYSDEDTSAHLSVAGFGVLEGELSRWAAHMSVVSQLNETLMIVAAGSVDQLSNSDVTYDALLSAAVDIGIFEIAASAQKTNSWTDIVQLVGSITAELTDDLDIRIGFLGVSSDYQTEQHFAAGVIYDLSEDVAITASVGRFKSQWYDDLYATAGLDVHFDAIGKAMVRGTASEGGYKVESEFVRSFQ